eukprot:GHVQ01011967.1.p1 GENE.GHVQ01011967.1~~GHVQ01011967.1.p1  ORF type:complete len:162 (+),score=29.46 GHVQ01011967.1:357-842(+)
MARGYLSERLSMFIKWAVAASGFLLIITALCTPLFASAAVLSNLLKHTSADVDVGDGGGGVENIYMPQEEHRHHAEQRRLGKIDDLANGSADSLVSCFQCCLGKPSNRTSQELKTFSHSYVYKPTTQDASDDNKHLEQLPLDAVHLSKDVVSKQPTSGQAK